jgi:ribonucleotide monophosphatase NagD (HAD superfamily)
MIILGDDPYCDMRAAANLGITSYRVMTGKYMTVKSLPEAMPKAEFNSIKAATKYLMVNDDE